MTRILTVANQKGGVGKTTTAVNLSSALGEEGKRVLLVDLDPQANATTGVGVDSEKIDNSTYDLLLGDSEPAECVVETIYPNLWLAPATIDLAGAEVELVSELARENRLKNSLAKVSDQYDFVIIDCPPSLGLLTINGFIAAREVLLPIQCEYYALEGVGQLVQNVDRIRSALNPELHISHVLLTMYDARTKLSSQVSRDVKQFFGDRLCKTVIPRSVRLSEAPSYGQPISVFDPLSRGAGAYRDLAKEVIDGEA